MLRNVEWSKHIYQRYVFPLHPPTIAQLCIVSFEGTSQGQLAMVIYEWGDYHYLGKVASETVDHLPVSISHAATRHALMSRVSRRRMFAPQMLCEVASAAHPISVTSSSTCQLVRLWRIPRSGLQEWLFRRAKVALATRRVKAFGKILKEILHPHRANIHLHFIEISVHVRLVRTPTPVPLGCWYITNRYNILSAKPATTALVCL
jgi:hypothetical protein